MEESMAKFCGKCGAKLDGSGHCPNCDGGYWKAAAPDHNTPPAAPVSRKEQRKLRKQAKRDAKKAAKRAKRAAMTTGQKVGRFFLKLLGILLALAVLATAAVCALVLFEIVDIPVVSNIMEKFIRTDAVETTDFQILQENAISRKVTDQESARQALDDIAPQLGIKDVEKELGECREDAVLGNTYYRFPQEYQGIPVYGRSVVVVTDNMGNVMFVSGNLTGVDKLNTKPTIIESDVPDLAQAYYNSEEFVCEVKELVIYSLSNQEPTLAWQALVEADGDVEYCFIDAKTGDILNLLAQNYTGQVQCRGRDIDDVNQTFLAEYTGDLYVMENTAKDITVYDANNSTLEILVVVVDENGKVYTAKSGEWYDEDGKHVTIEGENFNFLILNDKGEVVGKNGANAVRLKTKNIFTTVSPVTSKTTLWDNKKAVTVMSRVSLVDDFWVEVFHRKGYDNAYGAIAAVFDDYFGGDTTNAQSSGKKGLPVTVLRFGTDNSLSLDVIAHEYTHSVERSISNMAYQGESGALMEAYSDIFGEIVEDWANDGMLDGDCDWIHNENRNLMFPDSSETPLPSSYQGTYWKNTADESDYGGVHTNNTVISHAAYLMWKGIDGSDTFEALTTEELAKLLYATLYTLPSNCTFSQFRTLTQHTAHTMNFTEKQLRCISNAFFQVGIPETELSVAKTVSLEVLYVDGTPDHDYTVYVQGNGTEQTYTSSMIEAKGLEFPDAGNFEITVVDNAHDYVQCSRLVRVTDTGGVEKLTMTIADKVKEENPSIPADAVEFNGHRYYLYDFAGLAEPTQNTWENAQAYCEAVGGYLATITTLEENDFLYRYMRQRGYASAYFGLSNTQTGAWQWGNGELLTYTNWHSGEPNNQNGNEHYGMFYENFSDGTWNDGKFDAPYTEPQQERQDIVSTVTASSYLPSGTTDSYEPTNVLDGDLATAWAVEKGTGETISFTFDDSYRIGGIVISVGYQKSDELYRANSRPAEIRVIGDNGFEQLCSVQDLNGRQEVVFNQFANTRSLSVTIENIYEGSDYSDICISEIAFLVGSGVSGSSDGGTAFLCEWGEPAEMGSTPNNSSQMQPTNSNRSIALVLDTSGSMSGTPIEETRKAASNFVFSVLPENAAVGVVTYTEYAQVRTDFTMDSSKLEEIVSNLSAGGGTNIDDGLKQAYNMLQRTSSKKKIIILMSDGEPNNGRTGDDLIAFADEIKQSGVYIYTLGFFDALGDRTSAQYLMEQLASDGCHYEVSSAEDLVFFFGDIASQINGQKYIYIRIACPVDVTVSYGGETLTSAENALNTRTDFGTLTFEDSEKTTDAAQTDQVKILRLKEGVDYDVKITGTGYGMMDYTIGFMDDDGQYSDLRYFEDIRITRNTMIEATAAVSDQSVLKVDTDGDGRFDIAYRAGQNEHAQQTKVIPWLMVALVAAGAVVLTVVLVVVLQKNKKRKVR